MANTIIAALRRLSYGKMVAMARKRKLKKFRKVEAVKALARERIGSPPPEKVAPNRKRRKVEKHKPTLEELLGEA